VLNGLAFPAHETTGLHSAHDRFSRHASQQFAGQSPGRLRGKQRGRFERRRLQGIRIDSRKGRKSAAATDIGYIKAPASKKQVDCRFGDR
jgi:hypothetical protein